MTTLSKEHGTIWNRLLVLANYDNSLMKEAQIKATDPLGRVCLKGMKQHIIARTNPALLATLDAAMSFSQAIRQEQQVSSIPHLRRIFELAEHNPKLPHIILSEVAQICPNPTAADMNLTIDTIVTRYEKIRSFH